MGFVVSFVVRVPAHTHTVPYDERLCATFWARYLSLCSGTFIHSACTVNYNALPATMILLVKIAFYYL